jgi:tetratricopeptide (TPR) repeat protein
MKDDSLKTRSPKPAQEQPKHLHEHETTEIHDPYADETLLGAWFRRTLEKGPFVWIIAGCLISLMCLIWIVMSTLGAKRSTASQTWAELILAKDVDARAKLGATTIGPASSWALLQAAEARYQEAFQDLPANRDAALPLLTTAHDFFRQARDKAEPGSAARRMAALGMARTLEARGDLDGAVSQYQEVARDFPDTPEGKEAKELGARLRTPEAIAFYKEFSAFKPAAPPTLPGLPSNHPALDGPVVPAPGLNLPGAVTLPPGGSAPLGNLPAPTPAPAP